MDASSTTNSIIQADVAGKKISELDSALKMVTRVAFNLARMATLRGGRMTKYKGITASYAPQMAALMLGVCAFTLAGADTASAQIINNGGIGAPCGSIGGGNFVSIFGHGAGHDANSPNKYTGSHDCMAGVNGANYSTFVGYQAGGAAWEQSQSALGPNAGNHTVGNDTTAMGHWAGGVAEGQSSSFFGQSSGFNATGDRLVAVGADSLRDASGTGSNTHPMATIKEMAPLTRLASALTLCATASALKTQVSALKQVAELQATATWQLAPTPTAAAQPQVTLPLWARTQLPQA